MRAPLRRLEPLLGLFMLAGMILDEAVDFGADVSANRDPLFLALANETSEEEASRMKTTVTDDRTTYDFSPRQFPLTSSRIIGMYAALLRGARAPEISSLFKGSLAILPALPKIKELRYVQFE